jgi:hypothetical protein
MDIGARRLAERTAAHSTPTAGEDDSVRDPTFNRDEYVHHLSINQATKWCTGTSVRAIWMAHSITILSGSCRSESDL